MVFIEFNGLPASGKTTIVNELKIKLNQDGIKIKLLEDVISYKVRRNENKIKQLIKALFSLKSIGFNLIVVNLVINMGFSIERIRYAMRLIKLNYQINRVLNTKTDVLLLDEGFIQFFTSIPHNKGFSSEYSVNRACKYLLNSYPNICIVNCVLPIEKTIERSKKRQSSISRFDNLNQEELRRILYVKSDNLNMFRSYIPSRNQYRIDSLDNIEKNVNLLNSIIKEQLLSNY